MSMKKSPVKRNPDAPGMRSEFPYNIYFSKKSGESIARPECRREKAEMHKGEVVDPEPDAREIRQ